MKADLAEPNFVERDAHEVSDGNAMPFVAPAYTRTDVNKAGDVLLAKEWDYKKYLWAIEVVNNWRAIHAGPLNTVKMTLANRAKKIDPGAIAAQRTKRIPAIVLKLEENHKRGLEMKLTQMHDIGGCRVILKDVKAVDELYDVYREATKKNKLRGGFIRDYDYVTNPKPTGYRGVHLVHSYQSDSLILNAYNDLKIEIQIRSLIQHYWATAVETVDFFTGQALKSNIGDLPWKRFLILVANEFARKEKRPLVPGAPVNEVEAVAELKGFSSQISALESFQQAAQTVEMGAEYDNSAAYYLLELDISLKTVKARGFKTEDIAEAQDEYSKVEAQQVNKPNLQTVLVSVDSLANLSKAYPSYYLDVSEFVKLLKGIIGA